ncbi:YceI-like domain-containing protein [Roseivirga pacifica]|uniref:YceI-like domain-containing protein n=1 Tax=Roseivirga pacifica TaxID=1267423 RepID=A0A1I0QTV4_9BACT|nr:YceI family protein [Roseivirga pacifica]RKQ42587.1 YceI-like domain-containing protein [Roseivirga pacifica]SEW30711.1 YceI-like domain-containing protein [Roseivirga pacifica]
MNNRTKILSLVAFMFLVITSKAQTSFTIAETGNKISVSGTSNLHDFTLVSEEIKGSAELFVENGTITNIKKVVVTLKTESLESSKSGLTKNAMKTLQPDANPIISYIAFDMPAAGKISGILNVAGYDSDQTFDFTSEMKGGKLYVTAKGNIKFTDFQLDPPSALAGTIKAKDDLQLEINLVLEEEK